MARREVGIGQKRRLSAEEVEVGSMAKRRPLREKQMLAGRSEGLKRLGMIVLSVIQVASTTPLRRHRVKGSLWLQAHDNVNIITHG